MAAGWAGVEWPPWRRVINGSLLSLLFLLREDDCCFLLSIIMIYRTIVLGGNVMMYPLWADWAWLDGHVADDKIVSLLPAIYKNQTLRV